MMAELYQRIKEEEKKSEAWDLYLEQFHYMITKQIKYKSFNEWYNHISGKDLDRRPAEDIIAEVEAIRKELKER